MTTLSFEALKKRIARPVMRLSLFVGLNFLMKEGAIIKDRIAAYVGLIIIALFVLIAANTISEIKNNRILEVMVNEIINMGFVIGAGIGSAYILKSEHMDMIRIFLVLFGPMIFGMIFGIYKIVKGRTTQ